MKIKTQLAKNYLISKSKSNLNQIIQDAFEAGWDQAFRVVQHDSMFDNETIFKRIIELKDEEMANL